MNSNACVDRADSACSLDRRGTYSQNDSWWLSSSCMLVLLAKGIGVSRFIAKSELFPGDLVRQNGHSQHQTSGSSFLNCAANSV